MSKGAIRAWKKRYRELLAVSKAVKKLRFALFLFFFLILFFTHIYTYHTRRFTIPSLAIVINKILPNSIQGPSFVNMLSIRQCAVLFRIVSIFLIKETFQLELKRSKIRIQCREDREKPAVLLPGSGKRTAGSSRDKKLFRHF